MGDELRGSRGPRGDGDRLLDCVPWHAVSTHRPITPLESDTKRTNDPHHLAGKRAVGSVRNALYNVIGKGLDYGVLGHAISKPLCVKEKFWCSIGRGGVDPWREGSDGS